MKILLDHCIDWRLKRVLSAHDVMSTREMGWEDLQNGRLLAAAAPLFDVFLTVDQNIKHEQNLGALPISVVVLIAKSNRTEDLVPLIPTVETVIAGHIVGQLIEVSSDGAMVIALRP